MRVFNASFPTILCSTFVCPTEILAFNKDLPKFRSVGAEVLACSVDSEFAHLAWSRLPKSQGGLGGPLDLPLLSDKKRDLSQQFGVLSEAAGVSLR